MFEVRLLKTEKGGTGHGLALQVPVSMSPLDRLQIMSHFAIAVSLAAHEARMPSPLRTPAEIENAAKGFQDYLQGKPTKTSVPDFQEMAMKAFPEIKDHQVGKTRHLVYFKDLLAGKKNSRAVELASLTASYLQSNENFAEIKRRYS